MERLKFRRSVRQQTALQSVKAKAATQVQMVQMVLMATTNLW